MKRYNFPYSYKPKVNFKDTLRYISLFKKELMDRLQKKYDAIEIFTPIASTLTNSNNAIYPDQRQIIFDNKFSDNIFQVNSQLDNYFCLISNELNPISVIGFYDIINRDAKLNNLDSLTTQTIMLDYYDLLENHNIDYLNRLIKEIYKLVIETTKEESLTKIYSASNLATSIIKTISTQEIEDHYPTIQLQQGFTHYVNENNLVILNKPFITLKSGRIYKKGLAVSQSFNNSCILYAYNQFNDKEIELITIASRPNGQLAKDQLLKQNPFEYDNKIYDQALFDEKRAQSISININFSNLMLFLLKKVHLAEVSKSIWEQDFLDFVKDEKIKIL